MARPPLSKRHPHPTLQAKNTTEGGEPRRLARLNELKSLLLNALNPGSTPDVSKDTNLEASFGVMKAIKKQAHTGDKAQRKPNG
jgi:hypothetical protein